MKNFSQKLRPFAPVVLRIGLALVFLWFGASQISDPRSWTAYVPDYVMSLSGLSVNTIVYLNGAFEIIFGSALLLGFFTRWAAFFLAIHMIDIAFIVGLDATGARDAGLAIATTAVWLFGTDWLSLDRIMKRGPFAEPSPLP